MSGSRQSAMLIPFAVILTICLSIQLHDVLSHGICRSVCSLSRNQDAPPPRFTSSFESDEPRIYDYGAILAHDQVLSHNFRLTNRSSSNLGIVKGQPETPCCSAIKIQPQSIPPGGSADILVTYKVGLQSGRRLLRFFISTDSARTPVITYALASTAVPEFESVIIGGSSRIVEIGDPHTQRFRLICRKQGPDGSDPPISVTSDEEVKIDFLPGPTQQPNSFGITESTTDLTIKLPVKKVAGTYEADLLVTWSSGRRRTVKVLWRVTSPISVSPAALIVSLERFTHALRTVPRV